MIRANNELSREMLILREYFADQSHERSLVCALVDVFFAVSQPDSEMDVLKTTALAQKLDPELEQFTIDFSQDSTSINLNLKWDRTIVSIPID